MDRSFSTVSGETHEDRWAERRARRLTQDAAAGNLGVDQPNAPAPANAKLDGFSAERLTIVLTALDQDVEGAIDDERYAPPVKSAAREQRRIPSLFAWRSGARPSKQWRAGAEASAGQQARHQSDGEESVQVGHRLARGSSAPRLSEQMLCN
jgi:hypothetical protein